MIEGKMQNTLMNMQITIKFFLLFTVGQRSSKIKNGKKVADTTYASNTNSQWMTVEQLSDWINRNLGDYSKV